MRKKSLISGLSILRQGFCSWTDVIITTHSPYILTSANILLYSEKIENNHKNDGKTVIPRIIRVSYKNLAICYKMEGGIVVKDKTVPEGTSKCDYLYITDGKEPGAVLVELKGVNVPKALKQISGTLDLYKDFF